MEGLPLLPGYSVTDPSRNKFNVPHNFDWKNGYRFVKKKTVGVGGEPLDVESVLYSRAPDPVRYDPSLTYGRTKPYVPPAFQPHFMLYANKCLTFKAFFKQSVIESPDEFYRVRIVNIIYFLEDDSITVMEPKVENAGFMQGRIVKRARIPKSGMDEFWHWKDLNLGMDIDIYGVAYHICDCDPYTKAWLESQGVELERAEDMPIDPYTQKRNIFTSSRNRVTPNLLDDKFKKFLDYDKHVLRFYAVWDRRVEEGGGLEKYKIYYYLADDTMDVYDNLDQREVSNFSTKAILRKRRIPKAMVSVMKTHVPIIHENDDDDVLQYYTPRDLIVGSTIFIMGRRFYLYDCDGFTRNYYRKFYNIEQPRVELPKKEEKETAIQTIPPYTGFGTHKDSMLSHCHMDIGSANPIDRKDFLRYLQNSGKRLRYTAVMDYVHPEDNNRQFVIEYRLSDGCIMIHEARQRNTGFMGGKFLKHTLVPKPGTSPDNPEYYTPYDFKLGDIIEVFGHRFKITGVDLAVYRYMDANPEKFPPEMVSEVRKHLVREGHLTEDIKGLAEFRKREEIAEPVMGPVDQDNAVQQEDPVN